MGTPTAPAPVKRIAGLLAASTALLGDARDAVARAIAPVSMMSVPEPWTVSRYYDAEIGPEIWRQYLALDGLIDREVLGHIKLTTNALEDRWRLGPMRPVNIDPGYVDLSRLTLASTKDASHRIYIGHGIYAEVCLRFVNAGFEPLAHTYADYAQPATLDFFNRVRAAYRTEIAALNRSADRLDR